MLQLGSNKRYNPIITLPSLDTLYDRFHLTEH